MDLRSHYPFWLLDQGIIRSYPSLSEDMRTEVVIVGAGISGALAAWYLCKAGINTIMVDKRHVGMGSTAASTALLQYEIDTPLVKLSGMVGENHAARSYLLCSQAIDELEKICRDIPEAGFNRRPSLQYASFKKDVADLHKEYTARRRIGIPLQWLEEEQIRDKFGFSRDAALLSKNAAEVQVYSLTHALINRSAKKGLKVFDHTEIKTIHEHKKGVELTTSEGRKIRARQLIIACGYESGAYIPQKVQTLHSTYAIVSEPFDKRTLWWRNALIWETASPYLYLRTTPDNRILVGGKDDDFSDGHRRNEALPAKAKELERAFSKLFPALDFKTDFKWAGVFSSTKDGLPYIGTLPGKPNTFFALGFGGNGIVFSVLAARIICNELSGVKDPDGALFNFNR